MVIWKFPLDITDTQFLEMPRGYKILTAQFQGPTLNLWAEVNPSLLPVDTENVAIRIVGTGNNAPSDGWTYLTTVQQFGGSLIWHIYV